MPLIRHIVAALLLGCALACPAYAQWYAGIDSGVNFLADSKVHATDDSSATVGSKTGYVVQMEAGYDFGGPKAEFEIGYRNSGLESLTDTNTVGGQTSSLSFMVNGQYEFLPKQKWHPFVGAGLGMARVSARWTESSRSIVKDSDWVFAYQVFAGVGYDIDKNWGLTAQYRYFATLDPDFTSPDGIGITAENHNHAIMLGLTYTFDGKVKSAATTDTFAVATSYPAPAYVAPSYAAPSYATMDAQPRRLWLPGPRQPRQPL